MSSAKQRDDRCFVNPHLGDESCRVPAGSEGVGRRQPQLSALLLGRLRGGVAASLPQVDGAYQGSPQDQSVYTGSAGVALLHLHLATSLHAGDAEAHSSHLRHALTLLTPSLHHLNTHRSTFLCGAAGPLALGAVVHAHLGNMEDANTCVTRLKELYVKNKPSFAKLPSELLFGHAGYLYALLFVNCYLPSAVENSLIEEVATLLVDTGVHGCESGLPSPLMYTWHGKHYLGAAHGLAGILTLLLQVPLPALRPRLSSLVQPAVDYLLGLQLPSGNLPSSLESSHGDRLVHWCHGAPGFVHLMAHAYRVFGDRRYLDAAAVCGEVVWERGLLYKGYGLCHGVSGNAYTFLQLHRLTGKQAYLDRAAKFAEWCLSSSERQTNMPDRPFSLFEGLAGTTYMYVDLLSGVQESRFPALELPVVKNPVNLTVHSLTT